MAEDGVICVQKVGGKAGQMLSEGSELSSCLMRVKRENIALRYTSRFVALFSGFDAYLSYCCVLCMMCSPPYETLGKIESGACDKLHVI